MLRGMGFLFWILLVVFLAAAFIQLSPIVARAHDAGMGWSYDSTCCNGNAVNGDCHHIPDGTVSYAPDGVVVTLVPGDHPQITRPHRWVFPFSALRQSGDDQWHACLWPDEETLRCLYQPMAGA